MSGKEQPTLTIIGGPNGSGKSTLTSSARVRDRIPVIDPDAIARELRPDAPAAVAVEAGREAIRRQNAYVESGASFAVETTLSGHTPLRLMAEVRERGYTVNLLFVGLGDPRTNIKRVANRVARGGHHVPDEDVQRRYERGMSNLAKAVVLAHHASIFDNSSDQGPIEVLTYDSGIFSVQVAELPLWVVTHLGTLLRQGQE